jgi:nucleoside-triphosphatase
VNYNTETLFLVTGPPGIGKTTCIRTVAGEFDPTQLTGFYCSERLVMGKRAGFTVNLLSGEIGLLAAPEVGGQLRFGSVMPNGMKRLGVTLDFLENVVCPKVSERGKHAKLIVIDEIGPMQASSAVFRTMVEKLLCGRIPVLASIALSDDPWISRLRTSVNDHIFVLDHFNREITTRRICTALTLLGLPRRPDSEQ